MTDQPTDQDLTALEYSLQTARQVTEAVRTKLNTNVENSHSVQMKIVDLLLSLGYQSLVEEWGETKEEENQLTVAKEEAKKNEKEAKALLTEMALQVALECALFGKLSPSGNTSAVRKTDIRFPTDDAEAMATAIKWVIGAGLGETITIKTHGYTKVYQTLSKQKSLPPEILVLDTPGITIADKKWIAVLEPVASSNSPE